MADGDEVVAETSESNNRGVRGIQIGADLVVSAMTVPATGGAGTVLTIADTTRNQAGAGAPASTTRFYLSLDSVWDAGDVALRRRTGPLRSGGGDGFGHAVTLLSLLSTTGRLMTNRDPLPGVLSAVRVPLCSLTMPYDTRGSVGWSSSMGR